jgi:hypothetical protein
MSRTQEIEQWMCCEGQPIVNIAMNCGSLSIRIMIHVHGLFDY